MDVIKETCYSNALQVGPVSSSYTRMVFKYKTFSLEGQTDQTQTMRCDIKLCMDRYSHVCGKAKSDDDCPKDEFDFTFKGYQHET